MLQDITNTTEFTHGVARLTLIAKDGLSHVQAWRRSYIMEPWRDRVEFITPQGGKYYPDISQIKRAISNNAPKMRERIEFYLKNGLENFFPGDEPKIEE